MPDVEAIAIHKNHSNMVKFVTADDEGYKKLSGHIFLMSENAGAQIRARWAGYASFSGKKT
jgi:hypothetical protein